MGLPSLKLKQDCVTRWNSTFDMFKRIILIKNAVISTLAILQNDVVILTQAEWEIVTRAIDVLQIFNEVTIEVSSEKTVSISKLLIFSSSMCHTMETYVNDINLPYEVQQMASTLKFELNKRFGDIEDNEIIAQASILDPRFKKYGFTSVNKFNNSYSYLRSRLGNIRQPIHMSTTATTSSATTSSEATSLASTSIPPSSSLLWKIYEEKVEQFKSTQSSTAAAIIELDRYMQESLLNRYEDPLKWWYERKTVYPLLYTFVTKRLCVTATSVPSERIFSEAGQIITQKRNRLDTRKSSQLIFLHNNL